MMYHERTVVILLATYDAKGDAISGVSFGVSWCNLCMPNKSNFGHGPILDFIG